MGFAGGEAARKTHTPRILEVMPSYGFRVGQGV